MRLALCAAVDALVCLAQGTSALGIPTITLDPSTTYQTMTGWEAVAFAADGSDAFPRFIDEVCERAIDRIGITRLRLEVRSGSENDRDYWSAYQAGGIDYPTYRCKRYTTVNDDADPDHIRWNGFHFSELDSKVEAIVSRLRERIEARGGRLHINLTYVAFTGQIQGCGLYIHDDPDEYAEFVLATYLHLQGKYGWVPDTWEVILEPDNVAQWDGSAIGRAIEAAARRLRRAGFTPRFIAPSTTNMGRASTYFDALVGAAPGALPYLAEVSYHRYGGVSPSNLQAIVDRALRHGLDTSMLEWWSAANTYRTLHEDLGRGRNSAWERGVLALEGGPNTKAGLCVVDTSDPAKPVVFLNDGTKYLRHYFAFIRPGAVRVGCASTSGNFDALAFANTDGRYVVVVDTRRGGDFAVDGLRPGLYGITYTTGTPNLPPAAYDVHLPDTPVGPGQALRARIPASGVITIYGKPVLFVRGDVNDDGRIDIADPVALLNHLFAGGKGPDCADAADANDDGALDIADAVAILVHLFEGASAVHGLPPPWPACGPDGTADELLEGFHRRCP